LHLYKYQSVGQLHDDGWNFKKRAYCPFIVHTGRLCYLTRIRTFMTITRMYVVTASCVDITAIS